MRGVRPFSSCLVALVAGCIVSTDPPRPKDEEPPVFAGVEFPTDMLWGTASSAYQAEGTNDPVLGTVPSNWAEWEELDKIKKRQRNPDGSGFYEHFDEDFALAQGLGTTAYRLGLEWARIEPQPGQFNDEAIQHYRAVLQSARSYGLEPIVTLYHWVVPTWVQSPKSGLDLLSQPPTVEMVAGNPQLRSAFSDAMLPYVREMGRQLGDLVDMWVVLNEPYTVMLGGYLAGQHPNGGILDVVPLRDAGLNFIISYSAAYDALKETDVLDANGDGRATFVGNAVVGSAAVPADPNSADDAAAAARLGYVVNEWMMNAWTTGDLDVNADGDNLDGDAFLPEGNYAAQLGNRLDYVGLNYYSVLRTVACPSLASMTGSDPQSQEIAANLSAIPVIAAERGTPISENGLEVNAPGFLETLRIYHQYSAAPDGSTRPIYILENGHGDCDDDQRAKYVAEHLAQLGLALQEGIPIAGYMLWSLTDNFEWHDGRDQCFGLYRVNYDTFERTETRTVSLYREIIAQGALDAELFEQYATGRYPTDCLSVSDPGEREACVESVPPNPNALLQSILGGACGL